MPNDEKLYQARNAADFIVKELLKDPSAVGLPQLRHALAVVQFIKKQIEASLVENIYGKPTECTNWLEGWTPFDFTGFTPEQILEIKSYYVGYVKDAVQNLPPPFFGTHYTIVKIEWRPTGNPNEFILIVCLNPPVVIYGPGGPGSTIDPQQPGKP